MKEMRTDSYFNLKHQLSTVPNVTFYKLLECKSLVGLFNSHGPKREAEGTHTLFQGTHRITDARKDLWRSYSLTTCSKQAQLEEVT